MKVFLAGGSGAIGKRLIPMLVTAGHNVVATTRTPAKTNLLRALGAKPFALDALNRTAVIQAVAAAEPDVVVHELTALSTMGNLKNFDDEFEITNRLRTEGTEYLLEAAQGAGVRRVVAQSYTGFFNIREGGRIKTEDDPLDPNPPESMRRTFAAIRQLEAMLMSADNIEGIALRYGNFYGPGTSIGPGGEIVELVRQRKFPVFGDGAGVWSFIHIDDAAAATLVAVDGGPAGIYNIVDDEPAEASVWIPELARMIGAKPPYHLPVWVGRLLIGDAGVSMMTKVRGSSSEKAKHLLKWKPVYSSWRDGFQQMFSVERDRAA